MAWLKNQKQRCHAFQAQGNSTSTSCTCTQRSQQHQVVRHGEESGRETKSLQKSWLYANAHQGSQETSTKNILSSESSPTPTCCLCLDVVTLRQIWWSSLNTCLWEAFTQSYIKAQDLLWTQQQLFSLQSTLPRAWLSSTVWTDSCPDCTSAANTS